MVVRIRCGETGKRRCLGTLVDLVRPLQLPPFPLPTLVIYCFEPDRSDAERVSYGCKSLTFADRKR